MLLEEALQPLSRFIIGNGKDQGYVFSHPGLRNYFYYEKLVNSERRMIESYYLNWGKKVLKELNEKEISPAQASTYVIQYYGAHLVQYYDPYRE